MNRHLGLRLLRTMMRIRMIETAIADKYAGQQMRCPVHLSIGQEAPSAAFAECVRRQDYAVSTHRGHAHYLAKGGDLAAMIAEIYGKETGCSAGKGGSMHLADVSVNFMGTSAIVGNSIPIGVGLALAAELRGTDQVSCVFLGDGAVEEGVFYESLNFAAVRSLPVLFICENNSYSVYSPLHVRQPVGRRIHTMVSAIGVESAACDGNDALATHRNIESAMALVRNERKPFFVEFETYRWREHCGPNVDDDLGYRPDAEVAEWLARDPITVLRDRLVDDDPTVDARIADIEESLANEVNEAFAQAEAAAFPSPATALEGVYA